MSKTTDYCYQCGNDHETPLDNFKLCKRCIRWKNIIVSFMWIGVCALMLFLLLDFSQKNLFLLIGLIFNIFGGYLLATGYLSVLIAAAGGWGGVDQEDIKKYGYKTSTNISYGLILLILGFFIQGLSLFIFNNN